MHTLRHAWISICRGDVQIARQRDVRTQKKKSLTPIRQTKEAEEDGVRRIQYQSMIIREVPSGVLDVAESHLSEVSQGSEPEQKPRPPTWQNIRRWCFWEIGMVQSDAFLGRSHRKFLVSPKFVWEHIDEKYFHTPYRERVLRYHRLDHV